MTMSPRAWCRAAKLWPPVLGAALGVWVAVGGTATPEPRTRPARVVSLAPSLTELTFALGVGDRVVGVTAQCDFPPDVRTLPKVGTFLSPNVERVLALRPDIVLATPSPANRRAVEQLRNLGVRVFVVDPQSVTDLAESMRVVGAELGVAERGRELSEQFRASIEEVRQRVAQSRPRKVLFVVGRNPLIAVGRGTIQDELVRLAAGVNIVAAHGWPKVSVEFVLREAPEVILDATMGSEALAESAGADFWQRFTSLPAVQNHRVISFMDDRVLRPGPRLPEGLRALAWAIHPEAFSDEHEPAGQGHTR